MIRAWNEPMIRARSAGAKMPKKVLGLSAESDYVSITGRPRFN
jgi:hypothetical protein